MVAVLPGGEEYKNPPRPWVAGNIKTVPLFRMGDKV
jgi:hypothetical protein